MGALVMLGTLFGLIVLVYGVVLRYDAEARRPSASTSPPTPSSPTAGEGDG